MSNRGYFSYFPTINYANTVVTNILAKVRFDEAVSKSLATFYPYEVKEGERADQISSWYYGSSYYDWVIYLANNITDPYHAWPKAQSALEEFLRAKYGTVANSQSQVVYWRNNYYADDTILTVPAYNALSAEQKFFWTVITAGNFEIVGYERKKSDIVLETNRTLRLTGAFAAASVGDRVSQSTSAATAAFANSSVLVLQHVTGSFANGACSAGTISSVTVTSDNTADFSDYFSPVTAYEHEEDLNESRKSIRLLQPQYISIVERDMKDLLSA